MSYDIRNLAFMRRDWEIYGDVEGDVVVVRARPRNARCRPGEPIQGTEITRLDWRGHLHAPAEPLHPSILDLIARRMAGLVREAMDHGYQHAQADIRKAIGL